MFLMQERPQGFRGFADGKRARKPFGSGPFREMKSLCQYDVRGSVRSRVDRCISRRIRFRRNMVTVIEFLLAMLLRNVCSSMEMCVLRTRFPAGTPDRLSRA